MDIGHLYIISLFESGQCGKGSEELSRFQREVFSQMERERLRDHQRLQKISAPFRVACAAQAIALGEYDIAENHIAETREALGVYPFCDYLEGVMLLKRGCPEKALAVWRKIKPRASDHYVRFRWLKERLPADDAEALKALPSLAWPEAPQATP